jgi:hypothetical protein
MIKNNEWQMLAKTKVDQFLDSNKKIDELLQQ